MGSSSKPIPPHHLSRKAIKPVPKKTAEWVNPEALAKKPETISESVVDLRVKLDPLMDYIFKSLQDREKRLTQLWADIQENPARFTPDGIESLMEEWPMIAYEALSSMHGELKSFRHAAQEWSADSYRKTQALRDSLVAKKTAREDAPTSDEDRTNPESAEDKLVAAAKAIIQSVTASGSTAKLTPSEQERIVGIMKQLRYEVGCALNAILENDYQYDQAYDVYIYTGGDDRM